jgi:3-dehydroquinate synthase
MEPLKTLQVETEQGDYPIHIGHSHLENSLKNIIKTHKTPSKIIMIADHQVVDLHHNQWGWLQTALQEQEFLNIPLFMRLLPHGEGAKSFAVFEETLDMILAQGIDRKTLIIALGGGVAGDHAGFAASVLLRGLDFIQIPTSLLAMVDSSVGGKTGINSRHGKNLIGSFYQPKSVLIDLDFLKTLPERHMRAGYAEMVKYGFIMDAVFFEALDQNIANQEMHMPQWIATSCACKADIVKKDEKEQGRRALLNFGHTFAHALEAAHHYDQTLHHGEAVSIGMCMALDLSVKIGLCDSEEARRAKEHLRKTGLPTDLQGYPTLRSLSADDYLSLMQKDKKAEYGRLRFILLERIGKAIIKEDVDPQDVIAVLARYGIGA